MTMPSFTAEASLGRAATYWEAQRPAESGRRVRPAQVDEDCFFWCRQDCQEFRGTPFFLTCIRNCRTDCAIEPPVCIDTCRRVITRCCDGSCSTISSVPC